MTPPDDAPLSLRLLALVDTGATLPTDWGRLGRLIRRESAVIPSRGWMTTLVILAVRAAGTGTAIFEVDQIQWRSLLGAPT